MKTKANRFRPWLVLSALAWSAAAAPLKDLPLLPDRGRPGADWLIDGSTFHAGVYRTGTPDEIALDNGLLRRTFRLSPNGATVGLDNLVTTETVLRGVKPEARVTIDGRAYDVGGLKGQPNYAYLDPEGLARFTTDPGAFQFVGFEVGSPRERFGWKRVRHHAQNSVWPPKGISLRMDYRMPDRAASTTLPSEAGRKKLLAVTFDGMTALPDGWTVFASEADPRSSFENEGKTGEIYTPAHTHAYAEHALPPGTRLVETTIDVGSDKSASWGPAIALVWKDRVIKFNVATGAYDKDFKPAFGVFDGGSEAVNIAKGELKFDGPVTLRLRIEQEGVYCDARFGEESWKSYRRIALRSGSDEPVSVRVGKLGLRGGAEDNKGEKGELSRLRVLDVAAYGDADEKTLAAAREEKVADDIVVSVHYELYDGIPSMSKWITVRNGTDETVTVDSFASEVLAVVEYANWVESPPGETPPKPDMLHVETDFAFGGFNYPGSNSHVVHWRSDPQYRTQVNYPRQEPCLLVVEPTYGPAQGVEPGGTFESCRAFELVYDSADRERRGLALKRMYRTIAPWVTENPLMHHMKVANPDAVRQAIDQAADVGFEMIIMSFGSGFNMDNENPDFLATWKAVAEYGKSKGIEMGAYSLLSSRRVGGGNAIVSPPGQRCRHGTCPALTSPWGQAYVKRLHDFFIKTGFMLLEHDGSYPGDVDVTARPPLQKGEQDSRWVQWRIITDYYKWCRSNGIYLNIPDYYYLSGANKCGMGYRETNWSLPRAQQVIHTRQNIYDGTWEKTPSMGWMFVPLSQYHGGGAAATIEPLDTHIDFYRRMIQSNLGMGVQACYRGPRLYDTPRVRDMVKAEVDWFKQFRDILESDAVHGRRADARDLDWMLHVNPTLKTKGMLVVFNPLKEETSKTLKVNLYYTGLTDEAKVSAMDGASKAYLLARDYTIELPVTVPAEGMAWYVME